MDGPGEFPYQNIFAEVNVENLEVEALGTGAPCPLTKKERIPTFEGLIASIRDVSTFAVEHDGEFHKGMIVLTAMPVQHIASHPK